MKALMLIVAITLVALALAYFAIGAANPSGLHPTNWTDAQIIRSRCHLRLIQPEWVSSNGSILMNWVVAETYARLAVIGIFWLGAVIFTIRFETCGNENVDANESGKENRQSGWYGRLPRRPNIRSDRNRSGGLGKNYGRRGSRPYQV